MTKRSAPMLLVAALWAAVSLVPTDALAGSVRGYYRRDGTYVAPHYRSNPDDNPDNNYTYPGNVNPYTGRIAPGNPDRYLERYDGGPRYRTPSPYRPYQPW
jgi:hypothetical protein